VHDDEPHDDGKNEHAGEHEDGPAQRSLVTANPRSNLRAAGEAGFLALGHDLAAMWASSHTYL
jgi:hypothetical protein